jgi:putative endonuclease
VNPAEAGRQGELAAARYLEGLGYRILTRGFHTRMGELDLVAENAGVLVFVEVKTRRRQSFDDGRGAVNQAKQRRIIRAAGWFLARRRLAHRPCRFDVIIMAPRDGGWSVCHLEDAFSSG